MQGTFLSAFGLSKADIPTVVTFSPKKLRGAQLTGAFSSKGIDTLLDGLFSGRIHSSPFQVLLSGLRAVIYCLTALGTKSKANEHITYKIVSTAI